MAKMQTYYLSEKRSTRAGIIAIRRRSVFGECESNAGDRRTMNWKGQANSRTGPCQRSAHATRSDVPSRRTPACLRNSHVGGVVGTSDAQPQRTDWYGSNLIDLNERTRSSARM